MYKKFDSENEEPREKKTHWKLSNEVKDKVI